MPSRPLPNPTRPRRRVPDTTADDHFAVALSIVGFIAWLTLALLS